MILFLAPYPDSDNSKEGLFQRVSSIDALVANRERTYLSISLRYYRKKYHRHEGNLSVFRLNFFIHFFLITRLFRQATSAYIHSLYYAGGCHFFFLKFLRIPIVLDLHGVVPEEEEFLGNNRLARYLSHVEKALFRKKSITLVTVTDAMANYYKEKYQGIEFPYVKYCIFPKHLRGVVNMPKPITDTVNFVYSGNMQKWQNVDLMLSAIANLVHEENYRFYILTGELDKMKKAVQDKISVVSNIEIMSLPPDKLGEIYAKCHYGFILRDDIIVNRVACPTKLIEYMFYGMTPIVLEENIGDFDALGYEYLKLDQLHNLPARRSIKNMNIIQKMMADNALADIAGILK
ncbi:glycosyltransferase family protein [Sphingobacterium paludis]|uniref:Glycosyltransferase involved in cell wall biosynthesis n=1 Tax=Sphingobacterium paludis TaxID=1476465 RepID=A0A4R7D284_9SPHI|nr:glycosyl transferase family 1 [Sphingobacterium paludis]TDS13695.1 hypothetical protein B0I21_10421 [Sphingobacterium paludis]